MKRKPKKLFVEKGKASEKIWLPPWWTNPLYYCLFFLLPFYFITVGVAGPYMMTLDQKVNNLNPHTVRLGAQAIIMFMLGCAPFAFKRAPINPTDALGNMDVNGILSFLGLISLACNIIYMGPLVAHPGAISGFFAGGDTSVTGVKGEVGRIPGITSFVAVCLPFFALYSVVTIDKKTTLVSGLNRKLFLILFFFILVRGFLASERLAIVEAAVAYWLPRATFLWRPGWFRTLVPYFGVGLIFALFASAEYFRSWQHYKSYYNNYWIFVAVRFLGYFITSINNGAGLVSHFPSLGMPALTFDGFYKLLAIFGRITDPGTELVEKYLYEYATPEFNSSGGLFTAYMDYGVVWGSMFMALAGSITGWLYRRFLSGGYIGIMLYPSWFLGLLDIVRGWIWGSSRFVPVLLFAILAAIMLSMSRSAKPHRRPLTTSGPRILGALDQQGSLVGIDHDKRGRFGR